MSSEPSDNPNCRVTQRAAAVGEEYGISRLPPRKMHIKVVGRLPLRPQAEEGEQEGSRPWLVWGARSLCCSSGSESLYQKLGSPPLSSRNNDLVWQRFVISHFHAPSGWFG